MDVMNYTFPTILVLIFVFLPFYLLTWEVLIFSKAIQLKKKENKFSLRLYQIVLKTIMWTFMCMLSQRIISSRSTVRYGFRKSIEWVGRGRLIIEFQVSASNCSNFKHDGY